MGPAGHCSQVFLGPGEEGNMSQGSRVQAENKE